MTAKLQSFIDNRNLATTPDALFKAAKDAQQTKYPREYFNAMLMYAIDYKGDDKIALHIQAVILEYLRTRKAMPKIRRVMSKGRKLKTFKYDSLYRFLLRNMPEVKPMAIMPDIEIKKPPKQQREWGTQQAAALKTIGGWWDSRNQQDFKQVFRLFGYAGTGKSTLALEIAQLANHPIFCAYTGKASMVLRSMGVEASTIHSLIYMPIRDEYTGKMTYSLKDRSDIPHDFIGLDECSMVDKETGRDIESLGIPILAQGDPFQIQPIEGESYFCSPSITPEAMLTEIYRTALDNPIIYLSMLIRLGKPIKVGNYGETRIVSQKWLNQNLDQVMPHYVGNHRMIVGANQTRHAWNNKQRTLLGYDPDGSQFLPLKGEILMCLKNEKTRGFINGSTWNVVEVSEPRTIECTYTVPDGNGGVITRVSLWREGEPGIPGTPVTVEAIELKVTSTDYPEIGELKTYAPVACFTGAMDRLHWRQKASLSAFDFGYTYTGHKAQGSTFEDTLIKDESYLFRDQGPQWRYSVYTRTSTKALIGIST